MLTLMDLKVDWAPTAQNFGTCSDENHLAISRYNLNIIELYHDSYCILCGWIKGFNSATYAIKCQQVVIELWLGSYSTVVG